MRTTGPVSARKALNNTRGSLLLEMVAGVAIVIILLLTVTSLINARTGNGLISTSAMANIGLVAGAVLLAGGLGAYVFFLSRRVSVARATADAAAAREAKAASVQDL